MVDSPYGENAKGPLDGGPQKLWGQGCDLVACTAHIVNLPAATGGRQNDPEIMTCETGKDLDRDGVTHHRDVSRADAPGDILGTKERILEQR